MRYSYIFSPNVVIIVAVLCYFMLHVIVIPVVNIIVVALIH